MAKMMLSPLPAALIIDGSLQTLDFSKSSSDILSSDLTRGTSYGVWRAWMKSTVIADKWCRYKYHAMADAVSATNVHHAASLAHL